jgi:hypothetical protein
MKKSNYAMKPWYFAGLSFILVFALTISMIPGTKLLPATNAAVPNAIVPGFNQNFLPANDDGSSDRVVLPFPVNFFGQTYDSLFVNNNGNVTFDQPLSTYTPFSLLTTQHPMIAPFFGDVDTRHGLSDITRYGTGFFNGHQAFGVTWAGVGVGYYFANASKLNKFQMLIVERNDTGFGNFDIIFNYDQIQWETGDASGGRDGLGGSSARIGYSNGIDASFELPGSAINGAFLDTNTASGLIHNTNSSVNGRYIFQVRNSSPMVYVRNSTLVNGIPLPLCPPNSNGTFSACTRVVDGFTLGYGSFSNFSQSRLYNSISFSGNTSTRAPFTMSTTSSFSDLLTFSTNNYTGPANVQYTFAIDGAISGSGLGCTAENRRRGNGVSFINAKYKPAGAKTCPVIEALSQINQTINNAQIAAISGGGARFINQSSPVSLTDGESQIDVTTVSQPSQINFNSSNMSSIQQAQTQVQQTTQMILQINQSIHESQVEAIQNLGNTIRLVNIRVTDPYGNPIPNLTVSSASGTRYTLDPANGNTADTTPPTISCPAPVNIEAGPGCTAPMPDIRNLATVNDNVTPASSLVLSQSVSSGSILQLGTRPVRITARDAANNSAFCDTNVIVRDTTPPVITAASASPSTLWPPNHKMISVNLSATTSDNCSSNCQITQVQSNEPVSGTENGDLSPDWQITGPLKLQLRAERRGSGNGRVYTITITCTDSSGNASNRTVKVTVPHDRGNGNN